MSKPTQHDQRLDSILQEAPSPQKEEAKTFVDKAKKFCFSKIGMALLVFVFVFLILIFLQPAYVFKKTDDNSFSMKNINYATVAAISLAASLCTLVIPILIVGKQN